MIDPQMWIFVHSSSEGAVAIVHNRIYRTLSMFHNFVFIIDNWKISADLKECALQLWELGYKPDFILESLCISNVSMYRWHNIFAEFSSVNWLPFPLLTKLKSLFMLCWLLSRRSTAMKWMHTLINLPGGLTFTMILLSYVHYKPEDSQGCCVL